MKRVGIVGFRGYSGAELLRLLRGHGGVTPVLLEHRADAAVGMEPLYRQGEERRALEAGKFAELGLDAVALATPHEVSIELTPGFLAAGVRVVDISGGFRLRDAATHERWYGAHEDPELLGEAAYGLPEFYRERIPGARLVANPGCYPTAANLALRPLVRGGLIADGTPIICDAKSGVSGAGRKPSLKTHFVEVADNFSAYAVLEHRHVPEVLQNSGIDAERFSFTAQLIPIPRGILETIYVTLAEGVGAAEVASAYESAYREEPFVKLYAAGVVPDLQQVLYTNCCGIGFVVDGKSRRAVIVSVIDNLVKGAAGQALQNLNLLLGFAEGTGLQ